MTPDEVIAEIWKIAGNDECDGATFEAISDQWWVVTATCNHKTFSGVSRGQGDLSTAFERVLINFRNGH